MSRYYTNVFSVRNTLHHRYIENGKRKSQRIKFKPALGIRSNKEETPYRDIYGKKVGMIEFDSIIEMYSWRKENRDYMEIYNDVPPVYQYIQKNYQTTLYPDFKFFKVFNLDIEVYSNEGFPYPDQALHPVTAITIHDMYADVFYVFAYKDDYENEADNVYYFKCDDEMDLLRRVISFFSKHKPDIITGWNTEAFDIPYIINRAKAILEEEEYFNLSPVGVVNSKILSLGEEGYNIVGIQHLDYMRLYKKFQMESRESYALNAISQVELSQEKVDYHKEYQSLSDLYDNNFKLFIDYNIRDTELIKMLNDKLKYIELIITISYMTRTNFEDGFGTVKIWEIFLFNELMKKNIILSQRKENLKHEFPGGYVKEPVPGMKEWMVVMDISSSYPNQIISFNISPETIVNNQELPDELKQLKNQTKKINGFIKLEDLEKMEPLLKKYDLTMTANCEFFRKDKQGIFPEIVSGVYEGRKVKKAESKRLWGEIQDLKNEIRKLEEHAS